MDSHSFAEKHNFLNFLDEKILICDGAMGTMLQRVGYSACPDYLNIEKDGKKKVVNVHLGYIKAGSDIIQTNTFGSNPYKLKSCGLLPDMEKINKNAVSIANEAIKIYREETGSNRHIFIAGDIGPTGKLLEPAGDTKYSEVVDLYSRQIDILVKASVDLILIETIMDLNEAAAAVEAVKKVTPSMPVACTMTFGENGVSMMGNKAEDSIVILLNSGCGIVGANCGMGSDSMLGIVKKMRKAAPDAKLIFQPNAGLPVLKNGKTTYNETPESMASNIKEFLPYKPSILGACCGSTPVHINKIAQLVR
jgi:5-methyltetrahydrofolate--homocysteine methyltransferase